ncbi:Peroxiredoxin-5 [Durusdinium trenchii]|uniref:Mitochondrial n=1 Tax=Durusdinium trenchii TaxID=1381693 RepID=A0ABP0RIM7_9DINO
MAARTRGCGQQMVALNLGLTSCTEIQERADFRLDVLTMLDVSSLMLSDAQLAELLGPCARSVRRAVLGGNRISEDDVLLDFLRSARDLHSLSLVGALGDGWGCLNALVEESVDALAPKLELLELSEQSCTGLASAFSVESSPTGSTFLQRSTGRVRATPAARGRRVRLWIVTSGEHLSPYGRMERMDDSWLPAMR